MWTLRCIYLLNFLCGLAVMGTIGDFSQTGREILRLLIGMFFLWCASRTYQGALCLWLLGLGNVALIGQYIGMVYLILDLLKLLLHYLVFHTNYLVYLFRSFL